MRTSSQCRGCGRKWAENSLCGRHFPSGTGPLVRTHHALARGEAAPGQAPCGLEGMTVVMANLAYLWLCSVGCLVLRTPVFSKGHARLCIRP